MDIEAYIKGITEIDNRITDVSVSRVKGVSGGFRWHIAIYMSDNETLVVDGYDLKQGLIKAVFELGGLLVRQ